MGSLRRFFLLLRLYFCCSAFCFLQHLLIHAKFRNEASCERDRRLCRILGPWPLPPTPRFAPCPFVLSLRPSPAQIPTQLNPIHLPRKLQAHLPRIPSRTFARSSFRDSGPTLLVVPLFHSPTPLPSSGSTRSGTGKFLSVVSSACRVAGRAGKGEGIDEVVSQRWSRGGWRAPPRRTGRWSTFQSLLWRRFRLAEGWKRL